MSGAPVRVVLLACGSFNPPTNMHLRMFELARDALHQTGKYKVIAGILSPVNDAYNKKELVSAKHRCAMVRLALSSSEWIRLDTWEAEQESWNETAKVLRRHKAHLDSLYNANTDSPNKKRKLDHTENADHLVHTHIQNGEGPIQIRLLCGADLLESFAVEGLWKPNDIEEIVSRHGLVCITRADSNPQKFIYESDVLTKYQHNINIVTEWISNDISATKIRRALKRGESVKYLLQDPVIDYIKTRNLYGAGDNKYLNHTTPSPNGDDPPDSDYFTENMAFLSPTRVHVTYRTMHDSFISQSVDSESSRHQTRGYYRRRHRSDLNYDEEHKRREYRSRDSSFDSLDSERSTSRSPNVPNRPITCMGTDIGGLVRRVRGMRVAMASETCV